MTRDPVRDTARSSGSSWLVPLADLSFILFVITAAALSASPATEPVEEAPSPPSATGGIAQGVASSIFVDAPGAPPIDQWLAQYHAGSGEQLTVEGHFVPADRARVAARAEELAQAAIAAGFAPRVILQPASQSQVQALFAYDAGNQVAQSLLSQGQT